MVAENPYALTSTADLLDEHNSADRDTSGHLHWAGRFGRYTYISWSMIYFGLFSALAALMIGLSYHVNAFDLDGLFDWPVLAYPDLLLWLGFWAALIVLELITLIFDMRRLHDLNRSALWVVPLFATQWGLAMLEIGVIPWESLVVRLPLLLMPGSPGRNDFGPPQARASSMLLLAGMMAMLLGVAAGFVLARYLFDGV